MLYFWGLAPKCNVLANISYMYNVHVCVYRTFESVDPLPYHCTINKACFKQNLQKMYLQKNWCLQTDNRAVDMSGQQTQCHKMCRK